MKSRLEGRKQRWSRSRALALATILTFSLLLTPFPANAVGGSRMPTAVVSGPVEQLGSDQVFDREMLVHLLRTAYANAILAAVEEGTLTLEEAELLLGYPILQVQSRNGAGPDPQDNQAGPGPHGEQEANGPQGEQESNGPQGEQERNGPQGEQERNGPQGEQERNGPQGEQEANGPQGEQESQWPAGRAREQWPAG